MLAGLLKILGSKTSREAVKTALPGAAVNAAIGTLTGGPVAGLAYSTGDLLLNAPVIAGARKFFPGTPGGKAVIDIGGGKTITKQLDYAPSRVESGLNLAASFASMPVVDYVTQGALLPTAQIEPPNISQERQIIQQNSQRQAVNNLMQPQSVAPGTQFQTQGIEQTFHYPGITLPPEVLAQLQQQQQRMV
jgi:hypothetical protein